MLSLRPLLTSWRGKSLALGAAIGVSALLISMISVPTTGAAVVIVLAIGIIVAALVQGPAASVAAALVASAGYAWLIADSDLPLSPHPADLLAIVAFVSCAVIVGGLNGRLRKQVRAARMANTELLSLLVISQELQTAVGTRDVLEKLRRILFDRLGVEAHVYLLRDGKLTEASDRLGPSPSTRADRLAAETWRTGAAVRRDGDLTALMLRSRTGPMGVLLIDAGANPGAIMEPALANGLANLLCLAIERSGLGETEAEVQAQRRAEELKTALLGSISHDFRTPLTTIAASATSLLKFDEQLPNETRRRLLGSIVEEGDRLNRYTANLLELSKLQAGMPMQTAEVIDVVEIVGAVLQRMSTRLGSRHLAHRLSADPVLVRTDPALLELVLLNVLDNAVIYSGEGSMIEISVAAGEAMAEVDIRDEGCGIPDSDLGKVFQRFHRVRRAEPRPRGSGLGLPIAKAFVEAFGGRIWVETPGLNGRGTRVAVRLPLSKGTE